MTDRLPYLSRGSAAPVGIYHIRVLRKMGLKNDIELTRYALQKKLVD
jgi:DNA-binding NarL/FixJ family response regulator